MKRRGTFLIALAGAVGAVILLAIVRHYQLRAATDAYIAQLKAQGEPMDLASVLPPPVPPGKNGVDTFRQAAALLEKNTSLIATNYGLPAMKMIAPGKAMVCWKQPDVRENNATNSWQEIAAAVAQNENIFAMIHQAASKPDFDFQIPYSRGVADLDFPKLGLADSKRAAQWLTAGAVYHLHAGDSASAVDDVRAMLALTQAMKDERFVISELVRMAIAQITVSATWEILQSPTVTDGQLAQLQSDWASLDFITSVENAMTMERVTGGISLEKWRASSSQFASYIGTEEGVAESLTGDAESFWARASLRPRISMWEYWWSYPDQLRSLKGYEVLMTSMRMAQTNGFFKSAIDYKDQALYDLRITNTDDSVFTGKPDFHSLLSEDILPLSAVISRVMKADVAKQTVTTAIALKRYQLKHGNYPPNLGALVPEFLTAVLLDPVDGKPLRYRPNTDGIYLLYSVGPNGKDDGGNPASEKSVDNGGYMSWLNNDRLDWVWPQPATPAEIRDYLAHPPKYF